MSPRERALFELFESKLSAGAKVLGLGFGNGRPVVRWLLSQGQPAGGVDGVVIWDALFHLPRAGYGSLLQRAHASLSPGGIFLSVAAAAAGR